MVENKSKRPIAIFLVFLIIVLAFGLIFWRWGYQGISKVLTYFVIFIVILGFLAMAFFLVYWLFFKTHRKDAIYILKQKIIRACNITPQPIKQELWFMGDNIRFMSRIGKIGGICRIQSSEIKKWEMDNDFGKEIPLSFQQSKEIYFITLKKGLIGKILGDYDVVGLFPEDIYKQELSFPRIYVKDSMFCYSLFDILWCSKHFRETWNIDLSIKDNIYRAEFQELLKELPNIVEDAIDLSGKYRKDKELTTAQEMGIQKSPKREE